MQKEKVADKEFEALELFINNGTNKEERLKYYLANSSKWLSTYKPLKEMGFEKFVRCIINGYELEVPPAPNYISNKADISYNYTMHDMVNKVNHVQSSKIIYARIRESISIEEAREIAKTLNDICNYYEKYIQKS